MTTATSPNYITVYTEDKYPVYVYEKVAADLGLKAGQTIYTDRMEKLIYTENQADYNRRMKGKRAPTYSENDFVPNNP